MVSVNLYNFSKFLIKGVIADGVISIDKIRMESITLGVGAGIIYGDKHCNNGNSYNQGDFVVYKEIFYFFTKWFPLHFSQIASDLFSYFF